MDVSQELMDGMQLNLHRQHWKRTNSTFCLMICTTFKVTGGHESELPPWNGLGGSGEGGSVFSQKSHVFPLLFDIVGQVKLPLTRFSVLLYMIYQSQIFTGFIEK